MTRTVMDQKFIDDHHIVERYLDDTLPEEEREAFEAYYLTHPEVVQQMELTLRVKVGFGKLARDGVLEPLLLAEKSRSPSWLKLAAAAAVAAIAIAVGVQFMGRTTNTPLLGRSAAEVSAGLSAVMQASAPYTVVRRRDSNDASIELPPEPQAILLRLDLANVQPSASYRVTLRKANGGDIVAVLRSLDAENGFVRIFVNSSQIDQGDYDIAVSPDDRDDEGVVYRIALTRALAQ